MYLDDKSEIDRLSDEYISLGFYTEKKRNKLVVFALNPRLKTRKQRMRDKKKQQLMRRAAKNAG
jgi:hypothetical protein